MTPAHEGLLRSLAELCDASPEMRFGQLLATSKFLTHDQVEANFGEVEDMERLKVMQKHGADLNRRQPQVA